MVRDVVRSGHQSTTYLDKGVSGQLPLEIQPETLFHVRQLEHVHTHPVTLTLAVRTPPVHHTDRLGRTLRAGSVVLGGVFAYGDVDRAVQRDKRELRQVDLVFLVEDLLARGRVRS